MSQNNLVRQLWYPWCEGKFHAPTQGNYKDGYPRGAIVHYTAGSTAQSAISSAQTKGYNYFVIDRDGKVYQGAPLDRWGYHAGESFHPQLGTGVSDSAVGIEVVSAGLVEWDQGYGKYKAWFHKDPSEYFERQEVRVLKQRIDNAAPGAYEKFTAAQEEILMHLLLWLKTNNPNVFSLDAVCGHDEVSPKRKIDPGGAMSLTMPQLRSMLKDRYKKEQEKT